MRDSISVQEDKIIALRAGNRPVENTRAPETLMVLPNMLARNQLSRRPTTEDLFGSFIGTVIGENDFSRQASLERDSAQDPGQVVRLIVRVDDQTYSRRRIHRSVISRASRTLVYRVRVENAVREAM